MRVIVLGLAVISLFSFSRIATAQTDYTGYAGEWQAVDPAQTMHGTHRAALRIWGAPLPVAKDAPTNALPRGLLYCEVTSSKPSCRILEGNIVDGSQFTFSFDGTDVVKLDLTDPASVTGQYWSGGDTSDAPPELKISLTKSDKPEDYSDIVWEGNWHLKMSESSYGIYNYADDNVSDWVKGYWKFTYHPATRTFDYCDNFNSRCMSGTPNLSALSVQMSFLSAEQDWSVKLWREHVTISLNTDGSLNAFYEPMGWVSGNWSARSYRADFPMNAQGNQTVAPPTPAKMSEVMLAKYQNPPSANWIKNPDQAFMRDVGDGWLVTNEREAAGFKVYRLNSAKKWERTPGHVLRIGGPADHPWVTTIYGNIYRWNGTGWTKIEGQQGYDVIEGWVVSYENEDEHGNAIYRYDETSSSWTKVNGSAVRIGGTKEAPWIAQANGRVYHWNGGGWAYMPGILADDVGDGWAVSKNIGLGGSIPERDIYVFNDGDWEKVAGGGLIVGGTYQNPFVGTSGGHTYRLK